MSQVKIRVQTLAVEQKVTHYLGLSAEVNCNYLVTIIHACSIQNNCANLKVFIWWIIEIDFFFILRLSELVACCIVKL